MFHEVPNSMPLVITSRAEINIDKVPETLKWILPVLKQLVLKCPYMLSEKATVTTFPSWNQEDVITFKTVMDPLLEELKFILELPSQTHTVYGLPLPMSFMFKKLMHTPAWPLIMSQFLEGDIPKGWCSVTPNNYIHTFDMLSTKLPNHQCEIVLAKDCSSLNLFLVTLKHTENGRKIITLHLPGQLVEIVPTGTAFQVKINGQITNLPTDNIPVVITEPTTGVELLRLVKKESTVMVTSWKYGLTLETDSQSVFVKPSELYRGQLCGACSDFISSLYNELRGPQNELYSTPDEFLTSYTISRPDCQVPQTTPVCESLSRNVVFERFVKGVQSICVSSVPINQCSGSCVPQNKRTFTQTFHCMPANLPSAIRLRTEAENGPITLTPESADHTEVITEFQSCAPVH